MLSHYWLQLVIVFVSIIIGAIASVRGTLFTQTLIDEYIIPLIGQTNPDYSGLLNAIIKVAVFYAVAAITTFLYNMIMVRVTE